MSALSNFFDPNTVVNSTKDEVTHPWYPGSGAVSSFNNTAVNAVKGPALTPNSSASDIYAALTQEQWENYVTTFVPIENQLIAYATDPNQVTQAMDAARTQVAGAYGVQAGATTRRLADMGTSLTPAQQQAQTRENALSQSLASVQAQNVARDMTINRQQGILGNPAPTPEATAQQAASLGV